MGELDKVPSSHGVFCKSGMSSLPPDNTVAVAVLVVVVVSIVILVKTMTVNDVILEGC